MKEHCSSLLYKYFSAVGLSYIEDKEAFILYKQEGATLQIHDVYSESGVRSILELRQKLIDRYKPIFLEGYVDKKYVNKERSKNLMEMDGFKYDRETEDYIYYIKKVKYD